jgi:aldose 1-epimerase
MMPVMTVPMPRTTLVRAVRILGAAAALLLSPLPMAAKITQSAFGTMPDGTAISLYTLTNANGLVCKVIPLGAAITELYVPDRTGRLGDVVLGFDNLPQYIRDSPCFGAVCGRVANRVANARFTLDGKTYQLDVNDPPNSLHGGKKGFNTVVWNAEPVESPAGPSIVLSHVSPDGDGGYPGTISIRMTYTLTDGNELRIDYEATTDKATPVNLTNHSYFNLAGTGDVLGHVLQLNAKKVTPTRPDLIPTGEIADIAGGPLDFTKPKAIGRDLGKIDRTPGETPGYNHCYVIEGGGRDLVLAARVYEPVTGRTMEVLTDQPAVQLYTSNSFDGSLVGKRGWAFPLYGGLCLETEHYPDSVNHPGFPTTILRPGEKLHSTTIYRFATK